MSCIDFHAHVLPGADHGSSSVETSLIQLKSAKVCGVSRVIATPHFYPHHENADTFIARRNKSYEILTNHLTDECPRVILGAEVLICDNIEEMPMLESLCISGTKILLLELPFTDFSDTYIYSVKALVRNGYDIVIAHAERYNPDNIDLLIKAGAKVQLNAAALSGMFISSKIKKWIKDGYVCAIGSDIHGPDKKAYSRFEKAIKRVEKSHLYTTCETDYLFTYTNN